MIIDENANREVVTDVKFTITGNRETVYDVLEQLRFVISEANKRDDITITVDTDTRGGAVYSEDGKMFEDQATLNRWEELQKSDIDLDAMVYLNRLKKQIEDNVLSEDVLRQKINFFTQAFLPRLLNEACISIKDKMKDKVLDIIVMLYEDVKYLGQAQIMKLGRLDVYVTNDAFLSQQGECKQKIANILREVFKAKGISDRIVSNLDINIINGEYNSDDPMKQMENI